MAAALGIAEHNGWAEFVTVGIRAKTPEVLLRERIPLVDPGLPSNPYHHEALEMPLAEAEALVARVNRSVSARARAALAHVKSRHGVTTVTLQKSPLPPLPPTLAEILASWTITCAADGMMYREALADEAVALGMKVVRYERKSDPISEAAEALGVKPARVAALLAEFGRTVGTPWRKEHRLAAAAALGVLARQGAIRI